MRPKLDKSVVLDLRTTGQLMQPDCRKPFSFCSAVLTEFTFGRPYSVSYGCCPGCYSIILDVTNPLSLVVIVVQWRRRQFGPVLGPKNRWIWQFCHKFMNKARNVGKWNRRESTLSLKRESRSPLQSDTFCSDKTHQCLISNIYTCCQQVFKKNHRTTNKFTRKKQIVLAEREGWGEGKPLTVWEIKHFCKETANWKVGRLHHFGRQTTEIRLKNTIFWQLK